MSKVLRWLICLSVPVMMLVPEAAEAVRCDVPKGIGKGRPDPGGVPTRVSVGIYVINIAEVDDIEQTFRIDFLLGLKWKDSRLASGKTGRPPCLLQLGEVWHPDVLILNQRGLTKGFDEDVLIDSQGNVDYSQRFYGDLSVFLNLRNFPFDRQVLPITILSRDYGPDEVLFVVDESATGRNDTLSITDWAIGPSTAQASIFYYEPAAIDLSRVNYEVEATRHPGYYFLRAIIPMMMIIFVSWTVFWLDPSHLGTQIGLSATVIVMLFIFQLKLGDILPRVSYVTRTDRFVLGSQILVILALVEAVTSGTLAAAGDQARAKRIDRWSRFIFPTAFAALLIFAFLV